MAKPISHQQTWNELGSWWDENIGDEGDEFHCRLIHPQIISLLSETKRGMLLDAGCGNGALSRKLSKLGFEVLGIDVSKSLLEGASKRTDFRVYPTLRYEACDLTSEKELNAISKNKFEAIICSMVMHDIPKINPLIEFVGKSLAKGGVFIFAIPHPCFNSPYAKHESDSLRIKNYVEPCHERIRSKIGQPIEQDTYHRPVFAIMSSIFDVGLVIDGYVEPSYSTTIGDDDEKGYWAKYPKIPPALIIRCRLP